VTSLGTAPAIDLDPASINQPVEHENRPPAPSKLRKARQPVVLAGANRWGQLPERCPPDRVFPTGGGNLFGFRRMVQAVGI
jgi:hypothetical protein